MQHRADLLYIYGTHPKDHHNIKGVSSKPYGKLIIALNIFVY